jgi:hypothetical protein
MAIVYLCLAAYFSARALHLLGTFTKPAWRPGQQLGFAVADARMHAVAAVRAL